MSIHFMRKYPHKIGIRYRHIQRMTWIVAVVVLLGQSSCNEPRDPDSYTGSSTYARVSVRLDSQSSSRTIQPQQKFLSVTETITPTSAALIIAVPDGTPFSEDYNSIAGYYDKQLLDLSTSTVTLSLPLNTPIQLFEYTFAQPFSLNSLSSANQLVISRAILGPFTLTGSTSSVNLMATLEYVVGPAFELAWQSGSYSFEMDEYLGVAYFSYEYMDWQTLSSTSYLFNETSRVFEVGTSPKPMYELENNAWVATSGHAPDSTFDWVDHANQTIYYTNPDFSAKLVGMIDLSFSGFDGKMDGGGDDEQGFMTSSDFTPGALGYVFEIIGQPDAEYRLDQIAESKDCSNAQFTTLEDFINYHSSGGPEFACKDGGDGPCLRFDGFGGGITGDIFEVIRDTNHNIISEPLAGTWEIQTIESQELLFFYPNDTSFFYDGIYSSFWSVTSGQVWEGHYDTSGGTSGDMYFATFNAIALEDYRRFLVAAPADTFVAHSDDSCNSGNWGEVNWGEFNWAP
jgi:hypothetical protein